MTTGAGPEPIADLRPLWRSKDQKAWYWYDWANSAFYTTVLSVLFAPYMITVAGKAAGCVDPDETCSKTVSVLGLDLAAGSLPFYLTSFATIASAFVLPVVGAFVDRSHRKKWHMGVLRLGRRVLLRAAVLHAGRELAARRRVDRDREHPRRLLAGQLLRDPRRHLDRGRARPRLLARLGVRLPRRRTAAGPQPRRLPRPRHGRAGRGHGRPDLAAVGGRLVGRLHDHPDGPPAQLRPAQHGRGPRAASSSEASASSSRP